MFKYVLSSAFAMTSLVYADSQNEVASKQDDEFFSLFNESPKAAPQKNEVADAGSMPQTSRKAPKAKMASQNRTHWAVYGDFLYWQPYVKDAAWTAYVKPGTTTVQQEPFKFSWDVGFRIGAKYKSTWESIMIDAVWTRFHSESSNSHSGADYYVMNSFNNTILNDPFSGLNYKATAHYKVNYDQFDLCMKKEFKATKMFRLYPFMGVRGLVLNQRFKATWDNDQDIGDYSHLYRKNNNSSVGLVAGLGNRLKLSNEFAIDFGGDVYMGYGFSKSRTNDTFNEAGTISLDAIRESSNGMKVMTDIMVNVNWMRSFYDNKLDLYLSAGYEFHYIFNTPYMLNGAAFEAGLTSTSQDTAFQGLTIRAGIGF